jgi:predicted HAD superfamily Cof-like phosphohydrolase
MESHQTNFDKVVDFNEKFGVPIYENPQFDIFDKNPKLVELRMNLIREEMRELEDAVKNKDLVETADALSDILYVVYGAGSSFGLNMTEIFNLVHDSNMSKLCTTEQEAQDTVKWYEENKEKLGYDSPAYRLSKDNKYYIVYNKSSGKILKSINYKPVDIKSYLSGSQ